MDNIPSPIQNLAKATLTKVADKFVDFIITKYTGVSIKVFEAQGDVEADKVKSKWELLEKPFWLQAEAKKMGREYSNFGNTLIKSSSLITATENNISEDNDVFWGLIEHAKEISNEEMQDLIAKIIAGEYNNPDTYSMSTLQILKSLGKKEVELFEKVCSLLVNNHLPHILFTGQDSVKKIMRELGIDFSHLQTLQSLGLFLPNDMTNTIANPEKKGFIIDYFDKNITFVCENENTEIKVPNYYGLSLAGSQILQHLNPKYNEEYYIWLKENYKIRNYKITESALIK